MCGIIGIYNCNPGYNVAEDITLGIYTLQHRGEEAAGVAVSDGNGINTIHELGLVGELFSRSDFPQAVPGNIGIGHNRYSTTGAGDSINNTQPFYTTTQYGDIAVVHNGNITNAQTLRKKLLSDENCSFQFQSSVDTEVALRLIITAHGNSLVEQMQNALPTLSESFSLIFLTKDKLIAIRDNLGNRPLVLGKRDEGYVFASETCALSAIGARYLRDVKPGEILVVDDKGTTSYYFGTKKSPRECIFESVYFARPDGIVAGRSVTETRRDIGRVLAREHSVVATKADIVIPVPDSGLLAAQGVALEFGIFFELAGIVRSHYGVGRTFILPSQAERLRELRRKLPVNQMIVAGKKAIVVEDSLIRGNTAIGLMQELRMAGVEEIYFLIACPPWQYRCFSGIDTPTKKELFANGCKTVEDVEQKVCEVMGVEYAGFISIEGLYNACATKNNSTFCDACLTGNYPMRLVDKDADLIG